MLSYNSTVMVEHHIQREILDRLMRTKSLRFSELKPDGMESNIFMYHVRQLQRVGYLTKNEQGGYQLEPAGLSYVDSLQGSNNMKPTRQPKIIAILALQNSAGQWLLVKRKTQPYINEYMFLSGQQHFDESLLQQAERELAAKHMNVINLAYRGVADIQILQKGSILTHAVAHVHSGTYDGPIPKEDAQFVYEWHVIDTSLPLMTGTMEVYELLKDSSQNPFMVVLAAPTRNAL